MKAFWASRKPRERFLIVVCVVVVAVGGWMVLSPADGTNRKLLSSTQARRQYGAVLRDTAATRESTRKLQASVKNAVYDDPPERLVPKVVQVLQDRARVAGIHLREIKPLRARRVATLTRVPLSVRFTTVAFAPSVVRFLYDIEEPARKLAVEKFTVTATDPKTRTVDVEVAVVAFTRGSVDLGPS